MQYIPAVESGGKVQPGLLVAVASAAGKIDESIKIKSGMKCIGIMF